MRAREIQVTRRRHPVAQAVFELLAKIPPGEYAAGLAAPVRQPLFEFQAAPGQHFRFLHVSEEAFVRPHAVGGQEREGGRQRAAKQAPGATR